MRHCDSFLWEASTSSLVRYPAITPSRSTLISSRPRASNAGTSLKNHPIGDRPAPVTRLEPSDTSDSYRESASTRYYMLYSYRQSRPKLIVRSYASEGYMSNIREQHASHRICATMLDFTFTTLVAGLSSQSSPFHDIDRAARSCSRGRLRAAPHR